MYFFYILISIMFLARALANINTNKGSSEITIGSAVCVLMHIHIASAESVETGRCYM